MSEQKTPYQGWKLGPDHITKTDAPEYENNWTDHRTLPGTTGRKDDAGKLQWHLLPLKEVEEVVRVLMYGAGRYGADNWQHVEDGPTRYYNAAMRHLAADQQGTKYDAESGLHHLAHAIASLLFRMHLERER